MTALTLIIFLCIGMIATFFGVAYLSRLTAFVVDNFPRVCFPALMLATALLISKASLATTIGKLSIVVYVVVMLTAIATYNRSGKPKRRKLLPRRRKSKVPSTLVNIVSFVLMLIVAINAFSEQDTVAFGSSDQVKVEGEISTGNGPGLSL